MAPAAAAAALAELDAVLPKGTLASTGAALKPFRRTRRLLRLFAAFALLYVADAYLMMLLFESATAAGTRRWTMFPA